LPTNRRGGVQRRERPVLNRYVRGPAQASIGEADGVEAPLPIAVVRDAAVEDDTNEQ
jgi:hypothetical protein